MSVLDTIKSAVGLESGLPTHQYRCADCGHEFESSKEPDRARCMECMCQDVERIDEG